jgi:hypothetical protein
MPGKEIEDLLSSHIEPLAVNDTVGVRLDELEVAEVVDGFFAPAGFASNQASTLSGTASACL